MSRVLSTLVTRNSTGRGCAEFINIQKSLGDGRRVSLLLDAFGGIQFSTRLPVASGRRPKTGIPLRHNHSLHIHEVTLAFLLSINVAQA